MSMTPLTPAQRRFLKGQAHALQPVVAVGSAGLTEAVIREADATLARHELIKVKLHAEGRDVRDALFTALCEALGAAPVQHIGKILVIYRPASEPRLTLPE
jgi:RNA-binding protein